MADAERTLPHLHRLGTAVVEALGDAGQGVRVLNAPLKKTARCVAKTLDKYSAEFRKLTDLARATFV